MIEERVTSYRWNGAFVENSSSDWGVKISLQLIFVRL